MPLDIKSLPSEVKGLFQPPLQEISEAFAKELKKNFDYVETEVVDCPDLTQQPFTLASEGLNGNTKIIELAGPPYLLPLVNRSKVYDLKDLAKFLDVEPAFIIGAGAGPYPYAGTNCEGIYNIKINKGVVNQQTRISKVDSQDKDSIQEVLPNNETRIALLGNLFVSEGKPGKVIRVYVKKRTGPLNFVASLRNGLVEKYKDKLVGIGGTFVLKEGKAKQHVMRDFSKTPLETDEQVNNWLKFYDMSAPLVAVGTFVSNEGGDLDLRVQHFHSFSHHGEAGHYHYDTTPETAEYLGYFNVGETLYRIDKPVVTHQVGRD